jgi:hypothetical protein
MVNFMSLVACYYLKSGRLLEFRLRRLAVTLLEATAPLVREDISCTVTLSGPPPSGLENVEIQADDVIGYC